MLVEEGRQGIWGGEGLATDILVYEKEWLDFTGEQGVTRDNVTGFSQWGGGGGAHGGQGMRNRFGG